MEVFTAVTLATMIWKVTSVLKYLSARQYTQTITQLIPWIAGVIVVIVASQADVSQGLTVFGNQALGQLNTWSLILAGVSLGSAASVGYDFKKARDNTDSASEPALGAKAE